MRIDINKTNYIERLDEILQQFHIATQPIILRGVESQMNFDKDNGS